MLGDIDTVLAKGVAGVTVVKFYNRKRKENIRNWEKIQG